MLSWRACELIRIDPKSVRREPALGDGDVRERLRSLAAERHRFGRRRLGILLGREGIHMLLNGRLFYSLAGARIVVETWRWQYSTVRPLSSPGYQPPAPERVLGPISPAAAVPAVAPKPTLH